MTYSQALRYIHSLGRGYGEESHDRMRILLFLLGDPQKGQNYIHVAGTNGKGSVTAYLSSILREAGLRTGSFTSPYITDFRERMQIDGRPISQKALASLTEEVKAQADRMDAQGEQVTQFEFVTALALLWFRRRGCQAAVIEAGIGGLLDATNSIPRPLAAVITSLDYDHTALLGGSLREIADHKCGIFTDKGGCSVISAPGQREEAWNTIAWHAARAGCALSTPDLGDAQVVERSLEGTRVRWQGMGLDIPLLGEFQVTNALTAVETARRLEESGLKLPRGAILRGIAKARLPVRMEVLGLEPLILVDGAHNPAGVRALRESLTALGLRRLTAVVGMLGDKDCRQAMEELLPYAGRAVTAPPDSPRALTGPQLAELAGRYCPVQVADSCAQALEMALEDPGDGVVVFGSMFLAAEARALLLRQHF